MKHRKPPGLLRRLEAVLLAAGTLWTVNATAGSDSAASAAESLRDALSMAVLQRELAAFPDLSLPVMLVLRQTPLLYSAGDGAGPPAEAGGETPDAAESDGAEPDGDRTEPDTDGGTAEPDSAVPDGAVPLVEEAAPVEPDPPSEPGGAVPDNGMPARTLVPRSEDGYMVAGRVYISSSRGGSLSVPELREPFDAVLTGDAPQVLILHSHGSEAYTPLAGTDVVWSGDHRTTDARYSVVKVGDEMAAVFGEAGISVLHDRTLYDYPNYTGSYDRSLAAINSYLAQYPSIRFILDVHRDSIADSGGRQYKVISDIDGVGRAAQLTLVIGSDGSGAPHPRWMENLKLAVAIQEQVLSKYPTLMRPILLRKSRYNQHATTGSLLVEVGASGNSPEEAGLAARLFAEEMTEVLEARTK